MKKIITLLMMLMIPSVMAEVAEIEISVSASAGNSAPTIQVLSQGVYTGVGGTVINRLNNYAFEGEAFYYDVKVTDADGASDIKFVDVALDGSVVSCSQYYSGTTWRKYECWYSVEPFRHGNFDLKVRASDKQGASVETSAAIWFLNPTITLSVSEDLVLPKGPSGSTKTSNTISITNDGEGGVVANMQIKGTDLYDGSSGGALCPSSNQLSLSNLKYYAEIGTYDSNWKTVPYQYTDVITSHSGLPAGSAMMLTIQITYPTPCHGNYDGEIYVIGETV